MTVQRRRGYAFEKYLTDYLNKTDDWYARRLGAPSTELPDILAVNNKRKVIIAIECKSTVSNNTRIPDYQIKRCLDIVDDFKLYSGFAILAYKFGRKNNTVSRNEKTPSGNPRKTAYYYYVWDKKLTCMDISCNNHGVLSHKKSKLTLEQFLF